MVNHTKVIRQLLLVTITIFLATSSLIGTSFVAVAQSDMDHESENYISIETINNHPQQNATSAQTTDLNISIDVPENVTLGDERNISTNISVPEVPGYDLSDNRTLDITIGNRTISKKVEFKDGKTTTVSIGHKFNQTGSQNITVEGNVTFHIPTNTWTFNGSQTVEISVEEATGAAFPVPESLRDEVNNIRNNLGKGSDKAFILATQNDLSIVLTSKNPQKGFASVDGAILSNRTSDQGLSFSIIDATGVVFSQTGDQTTVSNIVNNTTEYQFDLVRVNGHHRRVSSLYDPDTGNNRTFSTATGTLVNSTNNHNTVFNQSARKVVKLSTNSSTNQSTSGNLTQDILMEPNQPHLHTFEFETDFWFDNNATVDGIVLPSNSTARQYVETVDQTNILTATHNTSVLYVVQEQFNSTHVQNVTTLNRNESKFSGDLVSLNARINGSKISVQETIEHNTDCGEDQANLTQCTNIVLDELVHTGIAWNTVPNSSENALPIFGISSMHQDTPEKPLRGRYNISGEVVSANQINTSLNGSVLVIHDIERTGNINRSEIRREGKQIIAQKLGNLISPIYSQFDAELPNDILFTERAGVAFPVPESLQDEIANYRTSVNSDLSPYSFVLATPDSVYIVFTTTPPIKGMATVQGPVIEEEIPLKNVSIGNSSASNLSLGVIGGLDATFETKGQPVSLSDVVNNPENYELELVQITAPYRRIATLTDPDSGSDFTLSTTTGFLANQSTSPVSLFERPGTQVQRLLWNLSDEDRSSRTTAEELRTRLQSPRQTHLRAFDFETNFWVDSSQTTVNGIVLTPGSEVRKYVSLIDDQNLTASSTNGSLLYSVSENFNPTSYQNITEVQQKASHGEVITVDSRMAQTRISIQEFIEHNTNGVCGDERLKIETPQGPVCINIVQDTLIHAGVGWNGIPTTRNDTLYVLGLSSRHQDKQIGFVTGQYNMTGKILKASQIDPSLSRGSVLVVFDLTREGNLNYSAIVNESRSLIENRTIRFANQIRAQTGGHLNGTVSQDNGTKIKQGFVVAAPSANYTLSDYSSQDLRDLVNKSSSSVFVAPIQNGTYQMPLPVGEFTVVAASQNRTSTTTDISVLPTGEPTANFTFNVSNNVSLTTRITVENNVKNVGNPVSVQVDASASGSTVSGVRMQFPQAPEVNASQSKSGNWTANPIVRSYNWTGTDYEPVNLTITIESATGQIKTVEVPVTVYIAGDVNGDGEVNIFDAVEVGQSWRCTETEQCYSDGADLNNDGVINIFDAVVIGQSWRNTAS